MTTQIERVQAGTIVNPQTGELVPLADAEQTTRALAALLDQKRQLQAMIDRAQDALLDEAARQGKPVLSFDGVEASVEVVYDLEWDAAELQRLVDEAGLPPARLAEFTKYEYKVDYREAQKVAKTDPTRYKPIIDAAVTRRPKRRWIKIREKRSGAAPAIPQSVHATANRQRQLAADAAEKGI